MSKLMWQETKNTTDRWEGEKSLEYSTPANFDKQVYEVNECLCQLTFTQVCEWQISQVTVSVQAKYTVCV